MTTLDRLRTLRHTQRDDAARELARLHASTRGLEDQLELARTRLADTTRALEHMRAEPPAATARSFVAAAALRTALDAAERDQRAHQDHVLDLERQLRRVLDTVQQQRDALATCERALEAIDARIEARARTQAERALDQSQSDSDERAAHHAQRRAHARSEPE